jgi:DNA-binding transcriptional LysR family regulator
MHAAVLKYFREVARQGSVRRAAGTLNVAASAVNRQILKLEEELGMPVFDRLPGRMRLTVAGELLLRHVEQALGDFERVRAEIDGLRSVKTGHVALAAVDSLLVDFLPAAIEAFRTDFPAVTYTVLALAPADIPAQIVAGEIDIGLTFVVRPPAGDKFVSAIAAPVGVVMPARHPLASGRQVHFADAQRYPILLQQGPLPSAVDIDPEVAAFRETVTPKLVSNSIHMLKQAIRQDMGIALFTRFGFLREIAAGEIVWRPFASRRINTLKLGIVVPTSRALPAAAATFVERLAAALAALEKSM